MFHYCCTLFFYDPYWDIAVGGSMRISLSGLVLFALALVTVACLADDVANQNQDQVSHPICVGSDCSSGTTCLDQCVRDGEEEDDCRDDCLQIAKYFQQETSGSLNLCQIERPRHSY